MSSSSSKKRRKSSSSAKRVTLRRKSGRRTELVDEQIRRKHAEYRLAIESKARKYGYVDAKTNTLVLDDEYFLQKPEGWDASTMGAWAHGASRASSLANSAAAAEYEPPVLMLVRSERIGHIAAFNNHYRTTFDALLRARERMDQLEVNDTDIKNAVRTLKNVSQSKGGFHQLGKSEVMKSVLDFMGPNSVDYTVLTKKLPSKRVVRANSI